MIKYFKILIIVAILLVPSFSYAGDLKTSVIDQYKNSATKAGIGEVKDEKYSPQGIVASIIEVVLSVIGMIFMGYLVMGAYWIFTANGEEEKAKKGQEAITMAIIGLAIILMSYGITLLVGKYINQAVTYDPNAL
ncbi:MAG: hypothetical protein WA057_06260 [Candidatus Magasanikiibacteriota bacterium]